MHEATAWAAFYARSGCFFPGGKEKVMIDIAVRGLEKYHGSSHVLRGVSFEVKSGEKIALLGKNGAGKTTLFQIIAGKMPGDGGEVMVRKGAVVGMLEQMPCYREDFTGSAVLYSAFERVLDIGRRMEALAALMGRSGGDCLERYGQLQREFESLGGYTVDEQVSRIAKGLNIGPDLLGGPVSRMSGGEKTRLSLGRLLLTKPDVILLDEPTNHLDMGSIEWLEGFLREYRGTVVTVSHDRYFLDRVVERIIELDGGKAEFFSGNYTFYAAEKEARYVRQLAQYEQDQKTVKRLEAAAARLHGWARQADNPALHRQAFNIEKRIERMDRTPRPQQEKALTSGFAAGSFSGSEIVVIKKLAKSFGDKRIFDNISLTIRKGERVALIGDNGCGKSTLLKIILGELAADAGEVRLGRSVSVGYLPQNVVFDEPGATVLEIARTALGVSEGDARRILANYRFRGEDVFRVAGNLSGGEKSRLRLCLLMQQEVNFLALDEPTNHLDTYSREWLEQALTGFAGTVLFVSHDRYLIAKYATRLIGLDGGKLVDYHGGYEYCRPGTPATKKPPKTAAAPAARHGPQSSPAGRIKLEGDILELESRLAAIDDAMQKCGSDYDALGGLLDEQRELKERLELLYERWLAQS